MFLSHFSCTYGPLKEDDPNYNSSLYNVVVNGRQGPVTCAAYAKELFLLHLPKWNMLKHIAKHQKTLTRAINQTKIRQVRRSATYQFGYLIPRDYKHALELGKINGNSRWYDATKKELDQINKYQVFIDHGIAKYDPKSNRITMHLRDTRKSRYTWSLYVNMMDTIKPD